MADTATLLALASALFTGLALVLTRFGLRFLDPLQGAATSIPTTAAMFLASAPFTVDWGGWNGRAALVFAVAGCLFPVSVTVLTFAANRRIGPHLTGALGNLTPVFAVAFAAVVLGELPRPWQAAGVAVVVFGATLLFATGDRIGRAWPWWSLLLPLAAAMIRGLIQPGVKLGFAAWPDPFAAVTIGYAVSSLIVAAAHGSRRRRAGETTDPRDRRRGRLWFAAVGVSNGVAVLALYAALARAPVALVAPLVATYPLATLALGAALLRDVRPTRPMVAGIVVTVAGVVLVLAA